MNSKELENFSDSPRRSEYFSPVPRSSRFGKRIQLSSQCTHGFHSWLCGERTYPAAQKVLQSNRKYPAWWKGGKHQKNINSWGRQTVSTGLVPVNYYRITQKQDQTHVNNIYSDNNNCIIIQQSNLEDYNDKVLRLAKNAGAQLKNAKRYEVLIKNVHRDQFSWFGVGILRKLGISDRPSNIKCPNCGFKKKEFQLDHDTPWRQYIMKFASENYMNKDNDGIWIRYDAAKALYNDPENLWWICKKCNQEKSDKIWDGKSHIRDCMSGRKVTLKTSYDD